MYRFGENPIKRRHRHMIAYVVVALLVVAGIVVAKHSLQTSTTISKPPPPVTTNITSTSNNNLRVEQDLFNFNLPSNWKFDGRQTEPYNVYTWESTDHKNAGRSLSIYVDKIPTDLGVNRAVLVQSNVAQVVATSDVSDNCANFTAMVPGSPAISTPAKWNGVPFLCDLGNNQRDVVGTVSADGINRITLTGAVNGQHDLFFTYTDNNIEPDFGIFMNALQTFRLK